MLTYWDLWAKTGTCNRWHALPFHLLDVAAAADVLWDRQPANAHALARQALGEKRCARQICVFLAATHDIGKANRYFQAKALSEYTRLGKLGANLPPFSQNDNPRHGQATGAHLTPWIINCWNWTES